MAAEFGTFDNANIMDTIVRAIQKCGLSSVTQNIFMSFLLPADYPPRGLSGGNYGTHFGMADLNIFYKILPQKYYHKILPQKYYHKILPQKYYHKILPQKYYHKILPQKYYHKSLNFCLVV